MPLGVPKPQYVTALPTGYDGLEIYFGADPANGVVWHLRYRAAAAGSYKWDFIGGPLMAAAVATQETTTSTSYADLATAGPTVVLPSGVGGDFDVLFGVTQYNSGWNDTVTSFATGVSAATAASDNDRIRSVEGNTGSANAVKTLSHTVRKTSQAAGGSFKLRYLVSAGTGTFLNRWVMVRPVRVG